MLHQLHRRQEQRLRWMLFVVITAVWLMFAPLGGLPLWLGVLVFVLVCLQSWGVKRVPVLAYHSVSNDGRWLGKPDLTVPLQSFQMQMRWLAAHGYSSLTMDQLLDNRKQSRHPRHPIVITFDDGYLDNWVGAEPVLKEHNLRGTIFVSSDWIESGEEPRSRLGEIPDLDLRWDGYLNKEELRQLANGHVMDIQSHASSHEAQFGSDQIRGFASPDNQPQWLRALMSAYKPGWYQPECRVPTGYPMFATVDALAGELFLPNPDLIQGLTKLASRPDFTAQPKWQERLQEHVQQFRTAHDNRIGQFETSQQTRQRWRDELAGSREHLEAIIKKPVTHLCWPRDAQCRETHKLAFSYGYRSVTADEGVNSSYNSQCVSRIYIEACGIPRLDLTAFVLQIWLFQGRIWVWPIGVMVNRLIRLAWKI